MSIGKILHGLAGALSTGDNEPSLRNSTTPTFVEPTVEMDAAAKRGDQRVCGDYQRSKIETLWAQQQQTKQMQQPPPKPNAATQSQQVQRAQSVQAAKNNGEFKPVTTEQVKTIMLPHVRESERVKFEQNLEEKTKRLNEAMQEFGINKPLEQVMFLATISHESRGTMALYEERSKHASSKSVYKGSGDMQLTGIRNYRKAAAYFKMGELVERKNKKGRIVGRYYDGFTKNAEARKQTNAPEWSSRIAGWFWTKGSVASKQMGDKPSDDLLDFRHASSAVNSGRPNGPINNWDDRVRTYRRALGAFKIDVSSELGKTIEEQQKIKSLPSEGRVHRTHNNQPK